MEQERRGWLIVAVLFVVLVLCYGTVLNTVGMFVTPLAKEFGWGRAKISVLTSAIALMSGVASLLAGWILDRTEAKYVMAAGVAIATGGYVLASQADSFSMLLCAHTLLGIGMGAAGLVPASLVVANWFEARRGFALGVTISGSSIGGLINNLVVGHAIASHGWRVGYILLAIPMAVIAIPLLLLTVETRPPTHGSEKRLSVKEASAMLPGLEVREALRSSSFWLLLFSTFCFWFAVNPTETHLIPYFIGLGYSQTTAASIFSLLFPSVILGKLVMGRWADRITGRLALTIDFILEGIAFVAFVYVAPHKGLVVPLVMFAGFPGGVPLSMVPMVQAEALGLKRFGSLAGLIGFVGTLGATLGPIAVGWLFDMLDSYALAFEGCAVVMFVGAMAVFSCSARYREVSVPVQAAAASGAAANPIGID
jgi:MFS family permease